MASFEILLISVRSDTPTSFFLVLSKTALVANWDFCCPGRAAPPAAAASFLRPARLVTACSALGQRLSCLQRRGGRRGRRVPWLMPDRELRGAAACVARCLARLAVAYASKRVIEARGMGSQAQCVERRGAALLRKYAEASAAAILPTMSQPTSAVSEVGASAVARTATPWLRALHR